jgi:hypothetical protein
VAGTRVQSAVTTVAIARPVTTKATAEPPKAATTVMAA